MSWSSIKVGKEGFGQHMVKYVEIWLDLNRSGNRWPGDSFYLWKAMWFWCIDQSSRLELDFYEKTHQPTHWSWLLEPETCGQLSLTLGQSDFEFDLDGCVGWIKFWCTILIIPSVKSIVTEYNLLISFIRRIKI